jgi:gamma-glutamylaminecyclotransferase
VYGTLKRGYGNHQWALRDGAVFLGDGTTGPYFTMYDGGFPMVVDGGDDEIKVEVFEVPDSTDNMDMLEGHPSHFQREVVEVVVDKKKVEAWMYLYQYPTKGLTHLPSGEWNGRGSNA